jgi:hypothetical protein
MLSSSDLIFDGLCFWRINFLFKADRCGWEGFAAAMFKLPPRIRPWNVIIGILSDNVAKNGNEADDFIDIDWLAWMRI